jgi:hypothetical protein
MSFEPIINIDNIKKAVAYQYSESQNLKDYIEILLNPFDELEVVFSDILNKRLFEDATTDALDTYGLLVAQPRESYDSNEVLFFGLDTVTSNPVEHLGLGDINDPGIGGIFRSIDQPIGTIVKLENPDYKNMITGKEHRNNFKGGAESLIDTIVDVMGFTGVGNFEIVEVFTTPTDPFVRIDFKVIISELQKNYLEVLDVLPKPGGIRYEYTYI